MLSSKMRQNMQTLIDFPNGISYNTSIGFDGTK